MEIEATNQMITEALQLGGYSVSISGQRQFRQSIAILDDKDKVNISSLDLSIRKGLVQIDWGELIHIGDPDFSSKVREQVRKSIDNRLKKCRKEIRTASKRKTRLEKLKGLYESE